MVLLMRLGTVKKKLDKGSITVDTTTFTFPEGYKPGSPVYRENSDGKGCPAGIIVAVFGPCEPDNYMELAVEKPSVLKEWLKKRD